MDTKLAVYSIESGFDRDFSSQPQGLLLAIESPPGDAHPRIRPHRSLGSERSAQRPPQVATRRVATFCLSPSRGECRPPGRRGGLETVRDQTSNPQSRLTSRTSDNPHRPRLASSPSPLPRGTFGYRQDNSRLSPQGLTQTPLAPAGEETRHGPRLNARTYTSEPRASAAGRKANPRGHLEEARQARSRPLCLSPSRGECRPPGRRGGL